MKKVFYSILLQFSFLSFITSQTQRLEPKLKEGVHKVGFKVYREYDYSRTYDTSFYRHTNVKVVNKARPIQITVWYPAKPKKSSKLMSYANYIKLMATEVDFNYKGDLLAHPYIKKRFYINDSAQTEHLKLTLQANSNVYENAEPLSGSFPVIVYSPGGFGSNFENARLCEYLASQGFIVASHPLGEQYVGFPKISQFVFEPSARDLEFVTGFIRSIPFVNMEKLGVMGFSQGGTSVVTASSRNSQIKAAVSIDGWHEQRIVKWLPFLDCNKINVPFLNLARKIPNNPNKMVYDSLKTQDKYFVTFNTLEHPDFCSEWLLLRDSKDLKTPQNDINIGYSLVCDYILYFFDGYLNNNANSVTQLKNLNTNKAVSQDFLYFEYKEKSQ